MGITLQKEAENRKEYFREYALRPEVKERRKVIMKKYLQKPAVKKRRKIQMREYNQRPEVKEYQRQYRLAKKLQVKE